MRLFKSILISLVVMSVFLVTACNKKGEQKIGIIVPLQNQSLDEIVKGFTSTLKESNPQVEFKIANAQGDLNLQRAIISQMNSDRYRMVVPIGTVATQMAVAALPKKNIVSLAANFSEADIKSRPNCHIAVVHDEIPVQKIVQFIHQAQPELKHIALIHSASDKIFSDVKTAVTAGSEVGIEIKPIMAPTLNDLYSVANAIPANTQAVLILKDIMIASGIQTILLTTNKRNIPLIASDQGSVERGASYAIGVRERMIGEEGAKLAHSILGGTPACKLPIINMSRFTIFINNQFQSVQGIETTAKQMQYTVQLVQAVGVKR